MEKLTQKELRQVKENLEYMGNCLSQLDAELDIAIAQGNQDEMLELADEKSRIERNIAIGKRLLKEANYA